MTTFLICIILFGTASVLSTFWTQQVVTNKPFRSGLTAGSIRLLLLTGMWFAFVNESWIAVAGMAIGEACGSYLGVMVWHRRKNMLNEIKKADDCSPLGQDQIRTDD